MKKDLIKKEHFLFGFGGYSGARTRKYTMHDKEKYYFVAL